MSKVIRKYAMTKSHYHVVDVDGVRIEVKNAIDDADAITKAEAIVNTPEIKNETEVTIEQAVEVLLKSDLTKTNKAILASLSTKLSTATKVPAETK